MPGTPGKTSVIKIWRFPGAHSGLCRITGKQLIPWINAGLSAAVYTQTTDVETEVNGFLTYDRKMLKMDLQTIAAAHHRLMQASINSIEIETNAIHRIML